jgi:hypothetical protein
VKRFEDGTVVVQLGERSIERDEEGVVDAGVADIVANGRHQQGEAIKGFQKVRDWRSRGGLGVRTVAGIRRQGAHLYEEVKQGLEDIDDVAEIVVEDELVVGGATREKEDDQLI